MQYSKYFFSMVGISLALAIAPGCENDSQKGGGGQGVVKAAMSNGAPEELVLARPEAAWGATTSLPH
jgi:hypothetical protein